MSEKVQRWAVGVGFERGEPVVSEYESDTGEYVEWADYAALQTRLAAAEADKQHYMDEAAKWLDAAAKNWLAYQELATEAANKLGFGLNVVGRARETHEAHPLAASSIDEMVAEFDSAYCAGEEDYFTTPGLADRTPGTWVEFATRRGVEAVVARMIGAKNPADSHEDSTG